MGMMPNLKRFFQAISGPAAEDRPVAWNPNLFPFSGASPSRVSVSRTSVLGVLNRDALVKTYNPRDPYNIIEQLLDEGSSGSSSGGSEGPTDQGENCILLQNPGLPHLNVGLLYTGTITTAPIVCCHGGTPLSEGQRTVWPGEIDGQTSIYPTLDSMRDIIWAPCYSQGGTIAHEITLSGTPEIQANSLSPALNFLHLGKFWFVQDFAYLLVPVTRAAIGPSAACVVGWFSA